MATETTAAPTLALERVTKARCSHCGHEKHFTATVIDSLACPKCETQMTVVASTGPTVDDALRAFDQAARELPPEKVEPRQQTIPGLKPKFDWESAMRSILDLRYEVRVAAARVEQKAGEKKLADKVFSEKQAALHQLEDDYAQRVKELEDEAERNAAHADETLTGPAGGAPEDAPAKSEESTGPETEPPADTPAEERATVEATPPEAAPPATDILSLLTLDVIERFRAKVSHVDDTNSCWPWTAARFPKGYGKFSLAGTLEGAHRVAWVLENNRNIPDGLWVLHKCDNRLCCRGSHLYAGTCAENNADTVARGRMPAKQPWDSSHFTPKEARAIRTLVADGMSHRQLADILGVDHRTIGRTIERLEHPDPDAAPASEESASASTLDPATFGVVVPDDDDARLAKLQSLLTEAGAVVPLEKIAAWTQEERVLAATWATEQLAANLRADPGHVISVRWPDHVSRDRIQNELEPWRRKRRPKKPAAVLTNGPERRARAKTRKAGTKK